MKKIKLVVFVLICGILIGIFFANEGDVNKTVNQIEQQTGFRIPDTINKIDVVKDTINAVTSSEVTEEIGHIISNVITSKEEYKGFASITINDNMPNFTEEDMNSIEAFEIYSELDDLGRCGVAFANICTELQPTEKRGEIGHVKPSGWHTYNYHELIDGNYLYNRCHLIGYQLAGENDNVKNLITGTRYLNVVGMLPYENMVDDYIDEHPNNHVLYRVTPEFIGNELVCRGLYMEAWSVEDNGALHFNIYCYNVQPGIKIDYSTGESELDSTVIAFDNKKFKNE